MDNMQVKAQVAQMLLASGYHPKVVTKVINLFPDPEETYTESKPYLDAKYKTVDEIKAQEVPKVGREQITI
jgi:predicted urease superfamily metal-dependent hydrolase